MSQTIVKLHFGQSRPRWQDRLAQAWSSFQTFRRDAATRRLLSSLDERALGDIGISRAQAQFMAEAPVWDLHR